MKNIFSEILNQLQTPKIEITANDKKDQAIADQYSSIIKWKIVQSRSDAHPECGYPFGKVLCRNVKEANEIIEKSEFNDLFVCDFNDSL